MKKYVAMTLAVLFIAGLAQVAVSAAPDGKITITMGGSKTTEFDHKAHVQRAEKDCSKCHHKDEKGKEQKCTVCHTKAGKDGVMAGKKAFHSQCSGCHKENGKGPLYPKDCKICHG